MADKKLPEPSNEFLSSAPRTYSRVTTVHVKNFTSRLKLARTLNALDSLKRDILRSDLMTNFEAKEELRAIANTRAIELKFKSERGDSWWN